MFQMDFVETEYENTYVKGLASFLEYSEPE